jgi:uncharacterized protein
MHIAVEELKKRLQRCYGERLSRFLVFGSRARGDYTPESDIDVLIIIKGETNWKIRNEVLEICYTIELEYEVLFNLFVYSEDDIQNTIIGSTPLIESIFREGIPV